MSSRKTKPTTDHSNERTRNSKPPTPTTDSPPSSSRWSGIVMPWSQRSSRCHEVATEAEILEAMNRANTQLPPIESEEYDTVDLSDVAYPKHCSRPLDYSYGRPEIVGSSSEGFSSTRSSQQGLPMYTQHRYSGHRSQQESVHSMQQFYHHHYRQDSHPLRYHSYDPYSDPQDAQDIQSLQLHARARETEHETSEQGPRLGRGLGTQTVENPREGGPASFESIASGMAPSSATTTITTATTTTTSAMPFTAPPLSPVSPPTPTVQRTPIINKTLARLTHQSHSCKSSSSSHSCISSSSQFSSASTASTIIHGSRMQQPVDHPPSPSRVGPMPDSPCSASTITAHTSPSSPSTLHNIGDSPSPALTLKMKAFEGLPDWSHTPRGPPLPIPDRHRRQTEISVLESEGTLHLNDQLPATVELTARSDSSLTLVTLSDLEAGMCTGGEDGVDDPCITCHIVDWHTIKAGLLPTSSHARDTLLAAVLVALVTIALEAILIHRHQTMTALATASSTTSVIDPAVLAAGGPFEISFFRPLTIYYYLFILAEIFAVGLLWDAAIHKNSLQVVAFTVFEWCMVSYSGLQIWQHDQLVKDIGIPPELLVRFGDSTTRLFLFTQLGLQVLACIGITLVTWRLYSEFGWLVFQKLGADVSLRKMMKEYRLLFTLLKLDAFFFLGYAIQIVTLTDTHWQKGLLEVAVAIPLSGIIILLGFYALRHENKVTMGGFISCLGLLIAYMVYRIYALYQTVTGEPATDPYFFSRKTMTVFAALTLITTFMALINAIVMVCNFNKGLKEAMQQYHLRRSSTIRSITTVSLHHHHGYTGREHNLASPERIQNPSRIGRDPRQQHGGGARGTTTHQARKCGYRGVKIVRSGTVKGPGHRPTGSCGSGAGGRSPKRSSRRSLLHYESTTPAPAMVERWQIE